MTPVRQLTLRGIPTRVQREIRELARREGISLNRAAVRLLEQGATADVRDDEPIGRSLDHLIGTWSREDADAVLDAIHSCEQIDPELWD